MLILSNIKKYESTFLHVYVQTQATNAQSVEYFHRSNAER